MADKKNSVHSESLHESHEPTHSDGLHSDAKAKDVAKKDEKESQDEADEHRAPIDRRAFQSGGAVPNDYPGGNPGNADNDRMHQAHAERAGHNKENESDVEFLAKPHHVLPPNATGLPDDEDVDIVGPAIHAPGESPFEDAEKKEEDKEE